MKNIFKLLLVGLLAASCGEVEPITFNGQEGGPNYLSFSRSVYSLPIERDATGAVEIVLNASTLSSVDRTYTFELVPNTSALAANPATYTVPASITIPAGSYSGTTTVTGVDNGLVDAVVKNFAIKITNLGENDDIDSNLVTFNVSEVCPLQAAFEGEYEVEQIGAVSPLTDTFIFNAGVYDVTEGGSPYERVINILPYPGFGAPPAQIIMTFGCDEVFMSNTIDTGLACAEGPTLQITTSDNSGGYDTEDDSTFDLIVSENSEGACGSGARNVTIRFTKVE